MMFMIFFMLMCFFLHGSDDFLVSLLAPWFSVHNTD